MAEELQRVAQQPHMTEASSGAMVMGFAMVSIEVPASARGALCKLAQLNYKDSYAALKLGPFEPLLEHHQVSLPALCIFPGAVPDEGPCISSAQASWGLPGLARPSMLGRIPHVQAQAASM